MLDVALLGCGGSIPVSHRYLSSVLVRYKGKMCLIDSGEYIQVALKELGWGLKNIDYILLTHYHGDHLFGLFGLLQTISNSERTEPLTIIGPKGIEKVSNAIKLLVPYLPYELIFIEQPDVITFLDLEIKTISLQHTIPCLGYSFYLKRQRRFDVDKAVKNHVPKEIWSKLQKGNTITLGDVTYTPEMVLGEERRGLKFSYITDSRPISEIPSFIQDSNLFICEGMYGSDDDLEKAQNNYHMTFREAATLAKLGNVDELILTHFSPKLENPEKFLTNAQEVFPNTVLGTNLLVRSLKYPD